MNVLKRTDQGVEKDTTIAAATVLMDPNIIMGQTVYRQTEMAFVQLWGNSYAIIERDSTTGEPLSTTLIHPSRVTPMMEEGEVFYIVEGMRKAIPARDMVHIRGLGFDPLRGKSVIQYANEDIELGIEAKRTAKNLYVNNAIPSMAITYEGKRDKEQRDLDKKSWNQAHGNNNTGGTAILSGNAKLQTVSMPLKDAEIIETVNATGVDVARWFGTPPHKLFDHRFSTFTNSGQVNREYHQDTLSYWLATVESEYNRKLLSPRQKETHQIRFNVRGLLRGDIQAQGDFYVKMLQNAVFTVNDVLRLENLNTIGAEGDKRLVNMNLTTLENAGEESNGSRNIDGNIEAGKLQTVTQEQTTNLKILQEYMNFMKQRENGNGKTAKA